MPSTPEVIALASALQATAGEILRAAQAAQAERQLTAFQLNRIQHEVHGRLLEQADQLLQAQSTALLVAARASVLQLNEALRDYDRQLEALGEPQRLLRAGVALVDAAALAVGFAAQPAPAAGINALVAFETALAAFTGEDE